MRLAGIDPERDAHRYPLLVGTRGHILIELDRLPDARSTLETARRSCEQHGVRWPLPSLQEWLAVERFLAGDWDDALAELEAAVALAEETGEHYSLVHTLGVRSLLALHRGDLRAAEDAAARAARELTAGSPRYRSHWATWVLALVLEAGGAVAEAYAALAGVWDWCRQAGFALEYPVLGPDLVRRGRGGGCPQTASPGSPAPGCAARAWPPTTPGSCAPPSTPTPRVPAPSTSPWPPRTPARPSPATATPPPPHPSSNRP